MVAFSVENAIWMIGCGLAVVLVLAVLVGSYRKPAQGQALVCRRLNGTRVSFSGLLVLPLMQQAELMDITLTRLVIDCRGNNALTCKDGTRIDVKAAFFVRVKPTAEAIKKVARLIGIKEASDGETLHQLFGPRFIEALKSVSQEHGFAELSDREFFKEQVLSMLSLDTDGYMLEVMAIDELARSKQNE